MFVLIIRQEFLKIISNNSHNIKNYRFINRYHYYLLRYLFSIRQIVSNLYKILEKI